MKLTSKKPVIKKDSSELTEESCLVADSIELSNPFINDFKELVALAT